MTPKEVIKFFKTRQDLAKALDINPVTIYYWIKNDFIPLKAQKKIEKLSRKKLKISSDLVTLAQIENLGKNSHKIIKFAAVTIRKWKKSGCIPFVTQRKIHARVKRQEQKNANAIIGKKKKARD